MNKFILITTLFLLGHSKTLAQNTTPDNRIDYHLSWDGISSLLEVDLSYNSKEKDSMVFVFGRPGAGGQAKIFEILANLKADQKDSLAIDPIERKITVHHKTQGLKHLNFTIDGKLIVNRVKAKVNEAFRPTIMPDFLYTLGYQLFMRIPDKSYDQVAVVWDRWPKAMNYFVSTDPQAKPDDIQIFPMIDQHTNTFMLQMAKDLTVSKYIVNKIPNYLLTSKCDKGSLPKEITPLLKGFLPKVRDFWNDYDAPFYILSAIPLQNKVKSTMTGMGMSNGLTIRYSGSLDLEKTELIAHEMSHNWIGTRLKYRSVGMENNWFNEGFNDYIAVYNLAKTGLFDKKAFLDYMNKDNLEAHYNSPVNEISGDSIEVNFFKSRDYEKIPYHRGLIYAFYLDNQIRISSNGKKTIRDFLLILYKNSKENDGKPITITDFTSAVSLFLPEERVAEEIQKYMLNGNLLDFHNIQLTDGFNIKYIFKIPVLSLSDGAELKKIYR